ncbi:penicillin-binding transpeptidase domain-containing protein [Aeromonas simiae]|uniref:penicillin-binding transpeptidase domain-containing protein n=1 Tax=Aeromonas simiae TaxID=218936 RepID=UPI0005A5DBF7|nr:penicillin-binding transpeptidase domain-containing protein [Aeromonas simiae]MDO2948234.1 penicillin-binding transpeptidase domain-containing protein [Aeromonas simiae]MDO2951715.1 penicillin-binding transpeptidase domain-containing protein [Aeromonas simiae]MDO2955577.1 penicillin-binding transpeptidase domain-containing protein [Aeromonas simiae]
MSRINFNRKGAKAGGKESATVHPWRFRTLLFFIGIAFGGLILRLAWIQVIDPDRLRQEGDMRSLRTTETQAVRGMVTDRNGEQLAVSVPVEAVWADPKTVHESGAIANERAWQALSEVLKVDIKTLKNRIANPKKRFVYLQRQVTPAVAEYIKGLKLGGVYLRPESRRFYPTGEISAHLVGVTNIDGHGIEGIERSYNDWLTATPGEMRVRKDRHGRVIEHLGVVKEGKDANDLHLSIDQRVQSIAYRALKKATDENMATSGSMVMLDIKTGEVLAMVNTPSYNPNNRGQYQSFRVRNRVVTDTYEPGSTVKPLILLSALHAGVTSWDDFIDSKPLFIGAKQIKDVSVHHANNLYDILRYSSNIGMSRIALRMQAQDMINTLSMLGFGIESGSGLMGESGGMLPQRRRWSDIERATLSFGYGLRVTPLQLVSAYATLANSGCRNPISVTKLEKKPTCEQVINQNDAKAMLRALEYVVDSAIPKAKVPGYRIGGKSGTAKVAVAGGYGKDYMAWFAGFAPASNPRFAMVVVINEPKGKAYYGGAVATPPFAEAMGGVLQLYNIRPDADTAVQDPKLARQEAPLVPRT